RKRNGEGEIREFFLDGAEMFLVENLLFRTGTIPESHFTSGLQSMEQVKQVRTHRRHTGTTTNKHHFTLRILNKKLTVRTRDGHFVTRPSRENKGRTNTWVHIHKST